MRNGEEEQQGKCNEIITNLKAAANRQCDISMDVETDILELEEATDMICCYRSNWIKAEMQVSQQRSAAGEIEFSVFPDNRM